MKLSFRDLLYPLASERAVSFRNQKAHRLSAGEPISRMRFTAYKFQLAKIPAEFIRRRDLRVASAPQLRPRSGVTRGTFAYIYLRDQVS